MPSHRALLLLPLLLLACSRPAAASPLDLQSLEHLRSLSERPVVLALYTQKSVTPLARLRVSNAAGDLPRTHHLLIARYKVTAADDDLLLAVAPELLSERASLDRRPVVLFLPGVGQESSATWTQRGKLSDWVWSMLRATIVVSNLHGAAERRVHLHLASESGGRVLSSRLLRVAPGDEVEVAAHRSNVALLDGEVVHVGESTVRWEVAARVAGFGDEAAEEEAAEGEETELADEELDKVLWAVQVEQGKRLRRVTDADWSVDPRNPQRQQMEKREL